MISWIVSQTDRFKAVSMGAGLSDLISMYGVTDIPEFSEAYFGGPPWGDMQGYLRSSAMNFVQNAKTPTLIQHGQEDRRVPISQGEGVGGDEGPARPTAPGPWAQRLRPPG